MKLAKGTPASLSFQFPFAICFISLSQDAWLLVAHINILLAPQGTGDCIFSNNSGWTVLP